MAYAVPPRWAHGDVTVSAANMNKYSDSIVAIEARVGTAATSIATLGGWSEATIWLFHRDRYLYFMSNGAIVDPAAVGDSVTLTETDGWITVMDLDTVDWLVYGDLYKVTGVSWCQEAS